VYLPAAKVPSKILAPVEAGIRLVLEL
jgi:hypothetical protein